MTQTTHLCGTNWLICRLQCFLNSSISFAALSHHLENQMSPTPLAWFVHQLPDWLLRLGAVVVLQCEITVPLLTYFAPIRRLRLVGFYVQVCYVFCVCVCICMCAHIKRYSHPFCWKCLSEFNSLFLVFYWPHCNIIMVLFYILKYFYLFIRKYFK